MVGMICWPPRAVRALPGDPSLGASLVRLVPQSIVPDPRRPTWRTLPLPQVAPALTTFGIAC